MSGQDESDLRDIEHALSRGREYAVEAVARLKRRTKAESQSPFKPKP